jgi:hypothetical protein
MSIPLDLLAIIDERYMPDTCEIRVKPAVVSGTDFGGGDDYDDTGWAKVAYTHLDGSVDNTIPTRVGTRPVIQAQAVVQGAEATRYTYTVAVPIVLRALVPALKPGDHVHWGGVVIEVAEVRTGSYSTSLVLAGERLY